MLCGVDPPWDLSFGWSQIEAVIELLFLFSSGPTSNHTRIQMLGDQVCDVDSNLPVYIVHIPALFDLEPSTNKIRKVEICSPGEISNLKILN